MRVLIVAAVLACAAAAPSGLLAGHYGHGLVGAPLAYGHAAPLAVAHAAPVAIAHAAPVAVAHAPVVPTIPPGDIHGAAIDAHVEASDHARAAVDQASELHGQAVNAAEDHAWQAVDAAQTAQAELDGAAAGVAPNVARQLAGHAAYAAPVVGHAAYAAPVVGHAAYAAPVVSHAAYAAPVVSHAAYAAPVAHGIAGSHSVATQSLSQTHPAPVVHGYAGYAGYGHGLAHGW